MLHPTPLCNDTPSRGSGHPSVPPERCPLRTMLTRQIRHRKVLSGSLSSSSRHRNASRCYLTKFADREICCFSRPFMAGTLLGPPPFSLMEWRPPKVSWWILAMDVLHDQAAHFHLSLPCSIVHGRPPRRGWRVFVIHVVHDDLIHF